MVSLLKRSVPLAMVALALALPALQGQTPAPPLAGAITSHPGWPQPRTADVDSVDHILGALYDVISGPAHQPRDWNRMRSLFVPDARLVPVTVVPGSPNLKTSPATDVAFLTIDDYIARASPHFEADGFFEHGVHNEIAQFGNIVSIFSTYESRHSVQDATPFARGINSIQLLKDGGRYWIVEILWDSERPGFAIPAKYLPASISDPVDPTRPGANFAGEWTGQLEYRDYQSDERVFLPTWLTIRTSSDGRELNLAYVYDDGPTKVVRETLMLTLFPQANSATVTSDREHSSDSYAVAGFDEFSKKNRGKLTFTGKGTENDKPVDVRIFVTLGRNLFTWRKETRAAGSADEFKFRDGYTFTRAAPPVL
jgi:hypothetical protein